MDMNQLLRALGLQQAYQAYQQNIGEPFAAVVGGAGRGYLGLDKPEYGGLLSEEAYKTGQAMGYMPAIGAPAGAFKAAAQAPGLLSDAAQFLRNLSPEQMGLLGITAFHGSPHRFGKFDASKIGTGEGAQAYGHGLYFAESPDVARGYRERLSGSSNNKFILGGKEFSFIGGSPEWLNFRNLAKQEGFSAEASALAYQKLREFKGNLDAASGDLRWMENGTKIHDDAANLLLKTQYKPEGGAFYTVDIPDEMIGKMLDWDKPLKQQPKNVQSALQSILEQEYSPEMVRALSGNKTGGEIVESLNKLLGSPSVASQYLKTEGVPGVRYLDQGSRGVGQGTRNFVVFPGEEEAIKMLSVD
jgi:hypothetical protein